MVDNIEVEEKEQLGEDTRVKRKQYNWELYYWYYSRDNKNGLEKYMMRENQDIVIRQNENRWREGQTSQISWLKSLGKVEVATTRT